MNDQLRQRNAELRDQRDKNLVAEAKKLRDLIGEGESNAILAAAIFLRIGLEHVCDHIQDAQERVANSIFEAASRLKKP